MKLYKPLFSIVMIAIQLIISVIDYLEFTNWIDANPEICASSYGVSIFLFVVVIGLYEMMTKSNWFKTTIRLLLIGIVLGAELAEFIPIDHFFFAVYNTAWFSATVAILLIFFSILKYISGRFRSVITVRKNETDPK